MPKVVVDLSKFDVNKDKVKAQLQAYEEILLQNKQLLKSHSIKQEIQNFENFKEDFLRLVEERNNKDFLEKYPEECEDIPPDDIDDPELANQVEQERNKDKFLTDKFGNVYLKPADVIYTHVELNYYVYNQFVEVKFLGNIVGVPTRFYIEKLEHNLSPTSLKILENIDDFLIGNQVEELIKTITEYIKRLDEACQNPKKKPQTPPPIVNWKEWGQKYFYPPPVFEEIQDLKEVFSETLVSINNADKASLRASSRALELFVDRFMPQAGEEDGPDSQPIRESLQKSHEEGSLDTTKKTDTSPTPPEPKKKDKCAPKTQQKELSQQALDLANKRWKEFQRKHTLECILKELKDCLIPNDFQFCDFFKDLDLNNFYKKLSLLKSVGLNDLYEKIEQKIEDDLGATQLREKSREITSLEKLVNEEEELLQYLTQRLEESDKRTQTILLELVKVEARIKRIQEQLSSTLLTNAERDAFTNKLTREQAKKSNLKLKLNRESLEKQSLPERKRTLSSNLERNRQQLESLKGQFSTAIEESQFDEKQAELIAGGKNLEAALLVFNAEGKVSEEAYKNAIINSIDSIVPFENLCQMLFQAAFTIPNITLPDNLDEVWNAFSSNFKDPFAGFFDKIALAVLDFMLTSLMQIIDSLLNSLCTLTDGIVANSLASTTGATGEPNWDKFGEEVSSKVQSIGLQVLSSPSVSKFTKFGVSTPNTTLRADLTSTQQVSGSSVVSPSIRLEGEGLIDLLTSTVIPQASPLSEWRLSQDRKSFTTVPLPEVFDFSQLDRFLTSQINEMIKNSNNWSAKAIAESFGDNSGVEEEQSPILIDQQSVVLSSLNEQQAITELKCLVNTSMSLMTPSQSMALLTKKADRQTKELLSSLGRVCAPNLMTAYPGLDFISNLIGEIGIAAGSEQFERRIDRLIEEEQFSPIAEEVICENFDKTANFVKALMSKSIPESLANEIFNEIQTKRLEQFNNIINSLTEIGQGTAAQQQSKTATDFYLEAIDKMIERDFISADGSKRNIPVSLDDLDIEKQDITQEKNLSSIVKDEAQKLAEQNSTLNAMFDLISISIFNPIKTSFNRDIGGFINTISSTKQIEKDVEVVQKIKDPNSGEEIEIPSLEIQLLLESKLVPAIKITLTGQRPSNNIIALNESISEDWSFESVVLPRDLLNQNLLQRSRTLLSNNTITNMSFTYVDGDQTILITYDGPNPTEEEPFYISNGFVEESFSKPFIKKPAKQKITRNEVGNKIIESLKEIKSKTVITPNSIGFSQKHGTSNDNPFSLTPGLFNLQQQDLSNISVDNNFNNLNIDPQCLEDLSLSIISGSSIDIINNVIPQNQSISQKAKFAIPTWSLEETIENNRILTELKSSGFIFTPYGNYFDFYHNTKTDSKSKFSNQLRLINSNKSLDAVTTFRNFFFNKIENDLGYKNLDKNQVIVNRMRVLLTETKRNIFNSTIDKISNNRLLKDFEIEKSGTIDIGEKSNSRINLKLIEYLNLTREPTEFEKENGIDPNIMDFEKLKSLFKEIEQKETEEEMNQLQIRGDQDYESKTVKAAKHILSLSFLKTCIIDYVLKGIFVYDSMNYRDDILYSDFLCTDIGNHVLKEAERYNLNEEMHRQLTKYYDFLKLNDMLRETQETIDEMRVWKQNSFYSSINCNPKMKKIVELELKKVVNKLKRLSSCSRSETGENTLSKNVIEDLEEYDIVNFLQAFGSGEVSVPKTLEPIILQQFREKGSLFLEKYVKIGNFNKQIENIQIGQPVGNLVNSSFLSNAIVSFQEFITIAQSLRDKGYSNDEIFNCDTNSETLFDEPPKFGLRVVLVADLRENNSFFNITFDNQQQGHYKTRTYKVPVVVGQVGKFENNLVVSQQESPMTLAPATLQQLENEYENTYSSLLKKRLYNDETISMFLSYFLSIESIWKLLATNSFLVHSDQQGKFLFESTKTVLVKMFNSVKNNGDSKKIVNSIEEMLRQQKEKEDNVGNPLGPSLEALKFFYRTPIQIMKGLATISDPNLGIADKIVAGASMASSLAGQKVDIPYSVASLALLPGPFPFSGIPPIPPPLTFYNLLFPVGPTFLLLEHLLKDLPYYQNQNQGNSNRGQIELEDSNNPFSCELLPEENETE